jgi:hypothetical protein
MLQKIGNSMFSFFSTVQTYFNFAFSIRRYRCNTLTEAEVKQTILEQLVNREANFLSTLKTNVFDHPHSPYLILFDAANITYADVEKIVAQHGIEGTLNKLYDANVYVTFEEFKGRKPIKRNGVEFQPKDSDFDNINLTTSMVGSTGGSTGKPSRTKMDLDHIAQSAKHWGLAFSIHGIFDDPMMMWSGLLPDITSPAYVFTRAHVGYNIKQWFSSFRGNDANMGWYYTLLTYLMIFLARVQGLKFPFPEYIPLDNPLPIVQALAQEAQQHPITITATISKCVRISVVAQQHNIDLSGVTFYGSSEPATPAKVTSIKASGAKFISLMLVLKQVQWGLPV